MRRVNAAYEQVVSWLINADGAWQYDDDNYSTIPEGTTNLVSGQSDYSFASTFLDVLWVKILDNANHWHEITPIDQAQIDVPLEEYLVTNSFPIYYDKVGSLIRLYPAPAANVTTLTNGMKVGFKRTASIFTSAEVTTGTKVPGFQSPFHIILAYMAAIPYCMSYKKDRIALFQTTVNQMKAELITSYTNREKDNPKVMTMNPISFR